MKKIIFLTIILSGFYFSTAFSQSWDSCRTGLATVGPTGILKYQSLTYLTTNANGMFYSSDNGSTWFPIYIWSGLSSSWLSGIIEKNGNLFAASRNIGIFKSTDLGYSWRRSDTGITNKSISSINSFYNKLYATTYGAGLFISTNNGLNWSASNSGIDELNMDIIKNYGSNLFINTYLYCYKSTNEGDSWIKIYNSNGSHINDICQKDSIIFISVSGHGVYRSSDNGLTWNLTGVDSIETGVSSLHLHNNILFANNSRSGIYRSTDNGITWMKCSYRLGSSSITRMSSVNNELYAFTDYYGLYKSTNNGDVWFSLNNKFLPYDGLMTGLRSQGNIIMGVGTNSSIFVSTNNGYSWSSYVSQQWVIDDLLLFNNYAFAVGWYGLTYSTDYGITWNANTFNQNYAYTVICKKENSIYFAETDSVIYKTTDYGNTFTSIITSGLPHDRFSALRAKGPYLFSGFLDNSIYRSSDDGLHWHILSNGLPVLNYTHLFVSDSALYTWTYNGDTVYRSTDYGNNWSRYTSGIPNLKAIQQFYSVEPYSFLYTNYSGSYMTSNNGLNWIYITALENDNWGKFVISQNYVVASVRCLMRSKLFDLTNINGNFTETVGSYQLFQNYPNPFNPVTTIGFEIPKTSNVSIKIFDIRGRLVKNLVNEEFEAGTHSVIFFAGDLASGIYFYRINAGDFLKTKKLILLK